MLQFSTYIFSADISPEMLKLGRVTKVRMLFLVLVFVFNFDLFKFSAAILEKGLSHVTQPLNRKKRNPPRLTEHPLSHPSTVRFLKYHLSSTSTPLFVKPLPTAKKPSLTNRLQLTDVTQAYVIC